MPARMRRWTPAAQSSALKNHEEIVHLSVACGHFVKHSQCAKDAPSWHTWDGTEDVLVGTLLQDYEIGPFDDIDRLHNATGSSSCGGGGGLGEEG